MKPQSGTLLAAELTYTIAARGSRNDAVDVVVSPSTNEIILGIRSNGVGVHAGLTPEKACEVADALVAAARVVIGA